MTNPDSPAIHETQISNLPKIRRITMTTLPTGTARLELINNSLYTPVIGDVLDLLGYRHQFLPSGIRPLDPTMVVAGRAMPVLIADIFGEQKNPFGKMTQALDQLQAGEIYLARSSRLECSAWGEILTATARMRGAVGAVIDGFHRDTPQILDQHWPVFSRGSYAQDAQVRTAVLDYRIPIEIDGVAITPGDLIVGDVDGVLVIPQEVEDEVLERALEKANGENLVRKAIENGMSSTEAFAHFGIL